MTDALRTALFVDEVPVLFSGDLGVGVGDDLDTGDLDAVGRSLAESLKTSTVLVAFTDGVTPLEDARVVVGRYEGPYPLKGSDLSRSKALAEKVHLAVAVKAALGRDL